MSRVVIHSLSFALPARRDRPSIQPRQWQQHLITLLRRRLLLKRDPDVLVFAGPGAGKTLGALLGFQRLREEGRLDRFIVFCHRTSILHQWQKAALRLGLVLQAWPCHHDQFMEADGLLLTYQAAGRQKQQVLQTLDQLPKQRCLAIADEAHHLGVDPEDPETGSWGPTFLDLTDSFRLRLGLTGTPFRADNLGFCAARRMKTTLNGREVEQICPDLCVEPRELIAAGDVRPLEFRFQDGWVEHSRAGQPDRDVSPLSAEQRESWRARNLRRAVHLADSSSISQQVLLRAQRKLSELRHKHGDAAGLVIARDIDHAEAIARLLREDGQLVELVHSQSPLATQRLNAFQQGQAQWLVSIDMCAEGFDAPRLRVVVYLTTVVTRSRFVQGITRAVRMTADLAKQESIPRQPSYVFAPADPLLMDYARSWSVAEPYLLRSKEQDTASSMDEVGAGRAAGLPLEAVDDSAGSVIPMKTPELPGFLQR